VTKNRAHGNEQAYASVHARGRFPFSFIRTMTVGPGISPGLLTLTDGRPPSARGLVARTLKTRSCDITAGGDFHPAPRTSCAEKFKLFRNFRHTQIYHDCRNAAEHTAFSRRSGACTILQRSDARLNRRMAGEQTHPRLAPRNTGRLQVLRQAIGLHSAQATQCADHRCG